MRDRELSKRQQECLEGRRRHMTAKEIGRQLNISHNTVAMHWRMARLKLRPARTQIVGRQKGEGYLDLRALIFTWRGVRSIDWASTIAAFALILAALLALILILGLLSLMIVDQLSLRMDPPYYGLFDRDCAADQCYGNKWSQAS